MTQPLLQSVQNTLRLLDLFNGPVQEMGLTEISKALSVSKSTAHRLLATLEDQGFIEQKAQNGRYRLGLKVVHLAAHKLAGLNIIEECHPYLEALSSATGESSHLSFYNLGEITFVDKVFGRNRSVMSSIIGYRLPAYASAAGKMFLAQLSARGLVDFFQQAELKPLTPSTITSRVQLMENLTLIRTRGHSEDQQESEEGLVCFAAPIWNRAGRMVAGLSLSGQASRMNACREDLIKEVKAAAEQASRQCGWLPAADLN